jgi:predicted transcriptional regulator
MDLPDFDLSLLDINRTNGCLGSAKCLPEPRELFGEFWSEGELAILFADTGAGKSALAVQIAESIARGKAIEPFGMTAKPRRVLYLDCELARKQFEMRYSAEPKEGEERRRRHYRFSEKCYRAEIKRNRELPEGFKTLEQYVRAALEPAVRAVGAKVLIVDNLTYLRGPSDSARESLPLMRELIRLKEELDLSILVIAHTPKRAVSRRITINDLQGSKTLSNLADSIFAIGQSGIDAGIRYLKQLKTRSGDMVYDERHVPAFELKKRDGNFLGFVFRKFSEEAQHLKKATDAVRRERAGVVAEMSKEGMSQRAIAAELGISAASVNRYLHMAEPWSDDRYNDDFFEEESEEEEQVRPEPEEDLDKLLEEKLESRRHTNAYMQQVGLRGIGYDDIYEEFENRREEQEKRKSSPPGQEGWPGRAGVVEKSHDPRLTTHDYSDDDEPRDLEELVERQKRGKSRIAVGEIEIDKNGRRRKRTTWGWDYCAEALE